MSTLAQHLKQRHQENRARVVALLQITDDELSEMIFETAYDYLKNVFGVNAFGMEHLPKTEDFWNWWRMEWAKIDSIFLSAVELEAPYEGAICLIRDRDQTEVKEVVRTLKCLRERYAYYHEASMKNRYINDSIVRAGAHEMINTIAGKRKEVSNG